MRGGELSYRRHGIALVRSGIGAIDNVHLAIGKRVLLGGGSETAQRVAGSVATITGAMVAREASFFAANRVQGVPYVGRPAAEILRTGGLLSDMYIARRTLGWSYVIGLNNPGGVGRYRI